MVYHWIYLLRMLTKVPKNRVCPMIAMGIRLRNDDIK